MFLDSKEFDKLLIIYKYTRRQPFYKADEDEVAIDKAKEKNRIYNERRRLLRKYGWMKKK